MTLTRFRKALIISVFALGALALGTGDAFASHFRYGSISWSIPNPAAAPRTVQIRFDTAWRWTYEDWYRVISPGNFTLITQPLIGTVITAPTSSGISGPNGEYVLRIMQGTSVVTTIPLYMTVTGIDNVADIMTASFTTTFTLPTAGTFRVEFNECCRLSTLQGGNADQDIIVTAGVTVSNTPPVNRQPVAATLPIMNVSYNQTAATFTVPAYDPDGDPLTFAIPLSTESGLAQVKPNGFAINPTTGVVTWNTTSGNGTVLNGLYAVQVRVSDNKGAYTVVDLLMKPVTAIGSPPSVQINGVASNAVFNVVRSTPMNFSVRGTDPDGAPVTLTSSPRPNGSTMTPSLPTTATGSVLSNFTWTPGPSDVGTYVITYSAIDGNGQQGTRSATINVTNNPPTVTCSANSTIEATSPAGGLFTLNSDLTDADAADRLLYQVFVDNDLRSTQSNLDPPTSTSFSGTFGLGNHTYEVRVTDSLSPPVSCTGTFSVADTTAPSISIPSDISLLATSASGAPATFAVTAHDDVDTTPTVACIPDSGSTFPIGVTQVNCTATDGESNSNTASFTVTVTQASTSLSPLTVSPNTLVGSLIEITTTLTRTSPPAGLEGGQPIRWVLTGPGPGDTLTQGSVTNSAGYAYLPFTPTQRGVYSLTAYFDGGGGYLASSQSPTATITVYQRTKLFPIIVNGTVGEALNEGAQLVALPDGSFLPGNRTVTFSYTGPSAVPPADVVGVGTYLTYSTFALPGIYTLTTAYADAADFITDEAGSIPPAPTVSSAPITVNPIHTHLADLTLLNNSNLVGTDITVQTQLNSTSSSGPQLPGRPVVFTLTAPSGATTITETTAAFGQVGTVFHLAERGINTIVATYAGDATTTASSSSVATFNVYQRTQLTVAPASGVAGAATTLAATLILLPQNTPLANQPVQLSSYGLPGILTGITDSSGSATATGVFPSSGTFPMQALFDGYADFFAPSNGNYSQPEVGSNVATITAAASHLAVTAPPNALVAGPLTVNAILTRTAAPAGPVDGAFLTIRLTSPSSTITELFAQTDANGMASVTFTPTERGVHIVTASYGGNQALEPSESATSSIGVYQRTQLTLASAAGGTSALPVAATLIALPQNMPVSNQQVQFSFAGVVPAQSAQTNGSGVATVLVAFSTTGTFASQASVFNAADFLTDAAGALPPAPSTASSTITITDATPPVITPAITGTLGSNGWYTSDVALSWNVTDPDTAIISSTGCGASMTTVDGPASFTCTATSSGGTASQAVSFKRDATAPTQALPANISIGATTVSGAVVNFTVARNDLTSGVASASCAPASGSQFAIGTTIVNCSVTDNAGLTTTGSFSVMVTDTIAPVITSAAPSQGSMWPPDHRLVPISFTVAATDNLGVAPVCAITSITSNEPQNGLGDGDTPNDWLITGPLSAQLRAERAGGGSGRTYTATIRCADGSGNTATTTAAVTVPKSQKK